MRTGSNKPWKITFAVVAFLVVNAIVYLAVSKRRVSVVPPDPYAGHPHVQQVTAKIDQIGAKQIITTEAVIVLPWNARIDWYNCMILKIDGHSLEEVNPYTAVYWDRCKSREKGRIMADLISRLH